MKACYRCGEYKGTLVVFEDKQACTSCFYKYFCQFCQPPVEHDKCPGHDILRNSKNRFMADKQFTDGIAFEYESDATVRPNTRGKRSR